ncbi:hypothetical protein EDD21DRAFT_1051 [Dissophora ornata]|nr:hypothetical protein EDD21DRAFT_1051 [Dissophora ornata]
MLNSHPLSSLLFLFFSPSPFATIGRFRKVQIVFLFSLSPQPVHSLDVSFPHSSDHVQCLLGFSAFPCFHELLYGCYRFPAIHKRTARNGVREIVRELPKLSSFEYHSAYLGLTPRVEAIHGRQSSPMALTAL